MSVTVGKELLIPGTMTPEVRATGPVYVGKRSFLK